MGNLKQHLLMLSLTVLFLGSVFATGAKATGRSFEECQALAVSRGVSVGRAHKVDRHYLVYRAAGMPTKPKGLTARCMAGLD
jgi:hypothetical protein